MIEAQPLVSIITPVYNGAEYLDGLIRSVLQQDYPRIEHIIIDDGSTDDGATVAVLQRYPHLRWWSRANQGQYATLNEGLAAARGSVVGIISADDEYVVPSAISAVVTYWQAHPQVGGVYGRLLYIDGAGSPWIAQTHLAGPWPTAWLKYVMFISHSSLFVARDLILRHQLWFDPALRYTGDWDWIIRLSQTDCQFGFLDRPLSRYRIRAGQASAVYASRIAAEQTDICRRNGVNYPLYRGLHRLIDLSNMLRVGWEALRLQGVAGVTRRAAKHLKRLPTDAARRTR